MTVNSTALLNLTTGMTLEAWVFPTALGTSWRNVLMKERAGGEIYNLYAHTDALKPAVYVVRAAAPSAPLGATGTAPLPLNAWTHLAATYDGTTLRLFVNGAQVGSRAVTGALLTSTGALRIGGNSVWGEYFQGRIDEVRIYNRALGAAEIQADMTRPVSGPASDTAPPVRSNGLPTGTLAAGTTQATLSLATSENATCRYATTAGVAYASMTSTFTTTGALTHSTTVSNLTNGGSYSFFVRCQDTAANANPDDLAIGFSVASSVDTAPPVRSNGLPTGTLAAGTTQATLSLATSENATCRYATTAGVAYASMTNTFSTTGTTAHATTVGGLVNGGSYSFFVRCQDTAANANPDDLTIGFSVGQSTDTTPPVRSGGLPTGTLAAGTIQTALSLATNENATCRYADTAGVAYASMASTFTTTGGMAHSTPISGLINGGSYSFFVRCQDASANADPDDFTISFSVAQQTDTGAPVRSGGLPTGTLAAGTTQTTISLATNENATCRYAMTAGVAYASMTNTFTTTGGTVHSTAVTGLTNGGVYSYFVRCQDVDANVNTNDFPSASRSPCPPTWASSRRTASTRARRRPWLTLRARAHRDHLRGDLERARSVRQRPGLRRGQRVGHRPLTALLEPHHQYDPRGVGLSDRPRRSLAQRHHQGAGGGEVYNLYANTDTAGRPRTSSAPRRPTCPVGAHRWPRRFPSTPGAIWPRPTTPPSSACTSTASRWAATPSRARC